MAALEQQGASIKVVTASADMSRPRVRSREGGGRGMDLRALINRSRDERAEKISPRFVVTLTGAEEMEKSLAESTLQSDAKAEGASKTPAQSAFGHGIPTVTGPVRKSAKDRLGSKAVVEVAPVEEEEDKAGELIWGCLRGLK